MVFMNNRLLRSRRSKARAAHESKNIPSPLNKQMAPSTMKRPSSSKLIPRPYPPPSLVGVPVDFVIDRMRAMATRLYEDFDSSDCTIEIPLPRHSTRASLQKRTSTGHIQFHLHVDYLVMQSPLFRDLFSGISPKLLATDDGELVEIISNSPDHPILRIPVPDPSSFAVLVHWLYFGDFCAIQRELQDRTIDWSGFVANARYLGLSSDIFAPLNQWRRSSKVAGLGIMFDDLSVDESREPYSSRGRRRDSHRG